MVSIIGAGPAGSSIAHRLAQRGRISSLRVIDENADAVEDKMLDIRQSGPVEHFDTPISTSGDILSAVSSPVIVVADDSVSGTWDGERGLAMVQRLLRAGTTRRSSSQRPHTCG